MLLIQRLWVECKVCLCHVGGLLKVTKPIFRNSTKHYWIRSWDACSTYRGNYFKIDWLKFIPRKHRTICGELWSICPKVDKNLCWIHHWWFSQSTSPRALKNNYFPRERGNPQPYLTPREAVFHVKGFLLILIWSFTTHYKFFAIYSTFLENPVQRSLGVFFSFRNMIIVQLL